MLVVSVGKLANESLGFEITEPRSCSPTRSYTLARVVAFKATQDVRMEADLLSASTP